jgi:hypothetical protein
VRRIEELLQVARSIYLSEDRFFLKYSLYNLPKKMLASTNMITIKIMTYFTKDAPSFDWLFLVHRYEIAFDRDFKSLIY